MITMNKALFRSTLILCLVGFVLSSCAVGPDYVKPQVDIPSTYKESRQWQTARPMDDSPRGLWWTIFADQELDRLMAILNRQNPSIAQAEAQYRQSLALLRQAEAGLLPSLSATAAATHGTLTPGAGVSSQYSVGASASWEADVWGGVRRGIEAGKAKEAASSAQLSAIRLSSQAQLASVYLQLVVADQQLRQLEDSEKILQQTLVLTRNQYNAGVASPASVTLAESQLKTAQALRVQRQLSRAQLEHAIAASLGMAPASVTLQPISRAPRLPHIPAGLPSTLLERRPDIASAERNMAQANAQIGVATAAFFPNLSLSASGGYRGASFADWISAPNQIWSVGPQLALSLFDGGLRRAQTDQAIAVYEASVSSYRQTVLAALQAVEDNLSAQSLLAEQAELQQGALTAATRAETIILNQYRAGTVGYLSVLAAQNTRIQAESTLWNVKSSQFSSCVGLISALGGSW